MTDHSQQKNDNQGLPTMPITLKPITLDNWEEACTLDVRADQQSFVASNLYSIAESKFNPSWEPMAIYAGEQMVGFVMWGIDTNQPVEEWWIIRLMIDAAHQGRGYGRAAAQTAIDRIRAQGTREVFLSFEPENDGAKQLYRSLGFADAGRVESGEIVYRLELE